MTQRAATPSRSLLLLLSALVLLPPSESHAATRPAQPAPRRMPLALPFAREEIVVIAPEGVVDAPSHGGPESSDARVREAMRRHGLTRAHRVGPAPRAGATARPGVWLLGSALPDFDPKEAARDLAATGAVRAASPNYRFTLFITQPSDPYLFYQWYVDDGDFADVRLPYAWDLERGDSSVVIAILDTGVDTTHPDLAAKIWHNADEIPGNGLDDDGNGFSDDVEGWDFGTGDNDPKPEYTPDASGIDVGFHGTFCAGIAAAKTDNADGIAGAGWRCRVMPLKVSHPDSGISSAAIAGAMVYAVDKGASVISMSFGGPGDPGVPEFFQALVDLATTSGALCVAAAGNNGDSTRVYPAACDNVLAVGATDSNNARASFSNWGPWVDLAAPGATMWSSICQNYTFTDLDQLFYIFLFGWDGVSPYMYGDGTSFACPLAAGVCGLVRARYPFLTPQLVMRHVVQTGDVLAYDLPIGPKLNAFRAVSGAPTSVAVVNRAPPAAVVAAAPNPIAGSGSIRWAIPAPAQARLAIYDVAGRLVRVLSDGSFPAGDHVAAWDGRDDRGTRVAAGVYFARLESGGAEVASKVVLTLR